MATDNPATAFAAFCSAGLWPGCGVKLARRVAQTGRTHPDQVTPGVLTELDGVSDRRADRLVEALDKARPVFDAAEVLFAAGAEVRLAAAAVRQLGPGAAAMLGDDPWRLLALPGVRPPQADAFARQSLTGARPDDPRRARALVCHLLAGTARAGHTTTPVGLLTDELAQLRAVAADAVAAALDSGDVVDVTPADAETEAHLALARHAMAEDTVAEGLRRLSATAEPLAQDDDVDAVTEGLDPAQLAAAHEVAEHGVTVLTGGPGTGKSRTIAAVVELATKLDCPIALAAPTGRAAKRMEELTGHEASTLHRLLGAYPTGDSGGGRGYAFARNEAWPLDETIVVVDEVSMLDVELAASLLDACSDGTHLLLVGDPAQLPSIGPGRVLADIIDAATVPVTELTTLHRQAEGGAIARLATAVRGGDLPPVDSPEHEVVVVPARAAADAAHRVSQLVTDSIPRALGIPAEEIQVVTPVHRGPAGTIALNARLKAELNPGPGANRGFDVGDRVVATANHPDEGFANGEVGTVTGVADDGLTVTFATGPVVVPFKHLGDLLHGWALTVHRAQGSEWPAVVAVLPREAGGMLSRPLVYTALTRAKQHLSIVHAAGPLLARAVRTIGEQPRRTRLAALLPDAAE
ncbi:MAG: AAA family ATPase [Streptosporangiales bacterium]|nr:AAA family ATPase [Streptosporangiales bacterium]